MLVPQAFSLSHPRSEAGFTPSPSRFRIEHRALVIDRNDALKRTEDAKRQNRFAKKDWPDEFSLDRLFNTS